MTCTSGSYDLYLDYLPENWAESSGGFPIKYEIQDLEYGQVATIRIPKLPILSSIPSNRPVGCTLQWINGQGPIVPPEKHEIWFSYCPANFSEYPDGNEAIFEGIRCYKSIDVTENVSTLKWYYATEGWDQNTILNPGVTDTPVLKLGACIIDPNKDFYINIRWDNITGSPPAAGGNVYTYWITGSLDSKTKSQVESSIATEYVIDPADQFAANVKLLLVFDGSEGSNNIIDYSVINKVPEVNENVKITTAQTKFNTGSGVATNDYPRLIYPVSQDFRTTSDWTLDFFIYLRSDGPNGITSAGDGQRFLSIAENRFFQLKLGDDSIPHLFCTWLGDAGGQMGDTTKGITGDLELNKWHHIALVHQDLGGDDTGRGGRWTCYRDGVAQFSATFDVNQGDIGNLDVYESLCAFNVFTVDQDPAVLGLTDGYLDEVRFTRSIRYVDTFTPPTRSAVIVKPTEQNPENPEKPVTSTIFERLGFNYSGPAIIDFSPKVIKVIETVPKFVPEWAYEDLRTNNVGDYIKNPVGDLANNIIVVLNSTKNKANSLSLTSVETTANNAYTNTVLFLEHTNRLSGLAEPNENTANLPHFDSATTTGQLLTHIVYQGDGYANTAVVMGNFTSILAKDDLQKLYDDIASVPLTETNATQVTSKINNLNNFLYQRVKHDEGFYSNSQVVLQEFSNLKEFTRMGSTETNLIHNYFASDKLKERGYLPYTPSVGEEPPIIGRPTSPPICFPIEGVGPEIPEPQPRLCTSVADQNYDLEITGENGLLQLISSLGGTLKPNEVAAVRFKLGSRNGVTVQLAPSTSGPAFQGIHAFVSDCPGDFINAPTTHVGDVRRCGRYVEANQLAFGLASTSRTDSAAQSSCRLNPDRYYYLNVRLLNPATGENKCLNENGCFINASFAGSSVETEQTTNSSRCEPTNAIIVDKTSWESLRHDQFMTSGRVLAVKMQPIIGQQRAASFDLLCAGECPKHVQMVVSECPGDFTNIPPILGNQRKNCERISIDRPTDDIASFVTRARLSDSDPPYGPFACRVDGTKPYYVNIRFIDPTTGQSGCDDVCGIRVTFGASP